MRSGVVVVGDEGVAEGLQLSDRLGLPWLRLKPFLQCLVEPLHFATGGGVVWFGVFLHYPEVTQQGGEAVRSPERLHVQHAEGNRQHGNLERAAC